MESDLDSISSSIKTFTKSPRIQFKAKTVNQSKDISNSVRSITEDIIEERILTEIVSSRDSDEYTKSRLNDETLRTQNYETEFDSDASTRPRAQRRNKSPSSTSTSPFTDSYKSDFSDYTSKDRNTTKYEKHTRSNDYYTQDFESLTERETDTELENFRNLDLSEKEDMKKNDFVKYLRLKLKLGQKKPSIKTDKTQIQKLMKRAVNNANSNEYQINKAESNGIGGKKIIRSDLVNLLAAKNLLVKLKEDQLQKIEEFGSDIGLEYTKNYAHDAEKVKQDLYIRSKCQKISSKLTNYNFAKHECFYADSIMLIADLAKTFPKFSDRPEEVWNRFIASLQPKD